MTADERPPGPAPAHITDHLANERTFLAWIRTSIALISLGFVVAKFSVWLRQILATVAAQPAGAPGYTVLPAGPRGGVSLQAGLALMGLGALVALAALARHQAVARAIEHGVFMPARSLVVVVTAVVVLAAVAFIAYLGVTATRW